MVAQRRRGGSWLERRCAFPTTRAGREVLQRACADSDFGMVRNWDRYSSTIGTPLHDDVTASLPNDLEAMLFKDAAHVPAGKDTELTHASLRNG